MRVSGAVVQVPTGSVLDLGEHLALRHAVTPQAIGDQALGFVLQPSEQALEEPFGGGGIPAILDQDVEHDAVLVHRTPEIMQLAIDLQKYLIEVPGVARLRSSLAEFAGELAAEGQTPLPDTFVADADAPLGEDQFDVPEAQAEQMVQPDCVADDLGWEAVSGVGDGLGRHLTSLAHPLRSG